MMAAQVLKDDTIYEGILQAFLTPRSQHRDAIKRGRVYIAQKPMKNDEATSES